MAEGRDGPEALLRRFDPDLHATAMFAAEPLRARLMALYGFDVELSRAARLGNAETGAMIALMRLQWWRDTVAEAEAGGPPKAHEIAGPLMRLIADGYLPADDLEPMIAAREAEVEGVARYPTQVSARFGALVRAALALLAPTPAGARDSVVRTRRASLQTLPRRR